MPLYRSTDFDVHRNWLALTHSLPMREWYFEATSQWTLDYPPFFALFEWLLAQPARLVDPLMLRISAEPYQSHATVLYQRGTVIVADLMLFYAIVRFVRAKSGSGMQGSWGPSFSEPRRQLLLVLLCFANPGLLLLDHVHFQYNGFLFGVFLLSLAALVERRPLWAAFWFAVTLHFKHIFLYVAPVFFIYLLCGYVIRRDRAGRAQGFSLWRLVQLGAIVLGVSAVSLGPYLAWGQGPQLLARLFPFQRGLCHAYWAPNVWVGYNVLDRALVFLARRVGGAAAAAAAAAAASSTGGLVEEIAHINLPTVKSWWTFVLTIAAMAPALWQLARRPSPRVALAVLSYASLCSFMLGWHVHEKAIMMTLLPLGLQATASVLDARAYLFLSIVGHYALLPLLFQPTETAPKLMLLATFTLASLILLRDYHRRQQGSRRIQFVGLFSAWERGFLWGLLPLLLLTQAVLPLLLPRMAFLPLLLTSLYCTLGTLHGWRLCYQAVGRAVQQTELEIEEELAEHEQ